jgi:DNA modification methylase
MKTTHRVFNENSKHLEPIPPNSVDLVVTSPPYPMIKMWDELFARQNPAIEKALQNSDGDTTFELMHRTLDPVWDEIYRVLKKGGIACINIGDATRTLAADIVNFANGCIQRRLGRHLDFVEDRIKAKGPLKYTNLFYGFPVMTA